MCALKVKITPDQSLNTTAAWKRITIYNFALSKLSQNDCLFLVPYFSGMFQKIARYTKSSFANILWTILYLRKIY